MSEIEWSSDVAQADWIRERLSPFLPPVATSQVPAGFAAYARVLHPVRETAEDGQVVRSVPWAEVAAHNGLSLRHGTQYQEIALLPVGSPVQTWPELQQPFFSLPAGEAQALVNLLRPQTGTAEDCWFCLWDGYAWIDEVLPDFLARAPAPSAAEHAPVLDPEDAAVPGLQFGPISGWSGWAPAPFSEPRRGPRVELPNREYVLYRGGIEAALAFTASEEQLPNLWWPADRAWCVATDLYGWWTYVGGSEELIAQILGSDLLEAQPADPDEAQAIRLPSWLEAGIDAATDEVMAGREGRVETSRGTVTATLRLPTADQPGELRTEHSCIDDTSGSGWSPVATTDPKKLRSKVRREIRWEFYEDVV